MHEDLRAELIKQFPSEVIEKKEGDTLSYVCPTCGRILARSESKCGGCNQTLSWENIRQFEEKHVGTRTATLSFEVPGDFTAGNCRKCPLSYISKSNTENVYECPLKMRLSCGLKLS